MPLLTILKRLLGSHQHPVPEVGPRFLVAETELPAFVRESTIAMRYYHLLNRLDWSAFPERRFSRVYPQMPISHATFAAAYLIKIDQGFSYLSQLRKYLVDHPELVWLLGFRLHVSVGVRHGFDPDLSLPTQRHLTRMLRCIPNSCFQYLLDQTVHAIRRRIGPIGTAISLDTKHILAWVKENNPKAYVSDRHDKHKQPSGDPDCRLGCKRRHNSSPETPFKNARPASQVEIGIGEFYWGYASGVVATKVPEWGEFVLAEFTQTFDSSDVSYFYPLMQDTERRLGQRPRFGAFDGAFDAFYIYDYFARDTDWTHGFAAIPITGRSQGTHFDADGHPICAAGLSLQPVYNFTCRTTLVEHQRTHYACPSKGKDCPIHHARAAKGGCTHRIPVSVGARLRHQIDHASSLYKDIYRQRTATERINSQAVELGIEHPYLRNRQAITNQNTLIYVLINLRAIQRIDQHLLEAQVPA